ncbi:MAG: hypothetical protein HQK54_01990 [Oligoflexales bacterium]|nr:hypothetical protein [Oligoflexales bacterium]
MVNKLMGSLFAVILCAGSAAAADFSGADQIWVTRQGSVENTQKARAAYQAMIDSGELKGSDLVYAVTQLGRTYFYEGEVLNTKEGEGEKRRRELFSECWKDKMELISPKALGYETEQYWYWRAACIGLYSEVSGTVENLRNVVLVREAFSKGGRLNMSYEGGGLLRSEAGIISNPKAKPIPGLYNPQKALELIDKALAQPAFPGSNNTGADFCENYRRKAMILKELGRIDESKEFTAKSLADFKELEANGMLPEGLGPETIHCMNLLEQFQTSFK